MAQIWQGLSYKIHSTTLPKFFTFGPFILVSGISVIIHQQLVAMLRGHVRFVHGHVCNHVTNESSLPSFVRNTGGRWLTTINYVNT